MPVGGVHLGVASDDPTVVRSIAVTAGDVVAALEANHRSGGDTVLRVTPPFSGRMRARLHRADADPHEGEPAPLHLRPESLVADPPAYPDPDDTEDALRADPEVTYSPERHRRRHVAAVEEWRAAVRDRIVDTATVDTPAGPREVAVAVLDG